MHKWLCTIKTYYASIVTDAHKTSIVSINSEHMQEPNSDKKIERQILRENCKRQAEDGISTRPIKIIRKELMNNVICDFEMKSIISIRNAMYDKRRQSYPLFPSSLNYAIRQLLFMKNNNCCILLQEHFIRILTEKNIVCLRNKENLKLIMSYRESSYNLINYLPFILSR
jgi:hypothetical protein